jgi:hypothetical protein
LNYRASLVAACVLNASPNRSKRSKTVEPHALIPLLATSLPAEQECNTIEDQVAALKMFFGPDVFTTDQLLITAPLE